MKTKIGKFCLFVILTALTSAYGFAADTVLTAADCVLDENYGVRILYEDFEGLDGTACFKTKYSVDTEKLCTLFLPSAQMQCEVGAAAEITNGTMRMYRGDDYFCYLAVYFGDGGISNLGGTYTAEYDYMYPSDASGTYALGARLDGGIVNGSEQNGATNTKSVTVSDAEKGKWLHDVYEFTLTDSPVLRRCYTLIRCAKNRYIDNYTLWYYPKNTFFLKENGTLTLVQSETDTYTLPAAEGICAWDGGDKRFQPGAVIHVSEIEHTALTAIYATETNVRDGWGVRLCLVDFNDGVFAPADVNPNYLTNVDISFLQTATKKIVSDDTLDPYAQMSRGDVAFSRVCLTFNNDAGMPYNGGRFVTEYDAAVDISSSADTCNDFLDRVYYKTANGSASRDYNHKGTCTTLINKANQYVHEEIAWTLPADANILNSYNIYLKSSGNQYYDNIAVWYYPENSFILSNGKSLRLITVTNGSYTFSDDGGAVSWVCGDDVYYPGDTVNIENLAYKTFHASNQRYILDKDALCLEYFFENDHRGSADGIVKLDFGEQNPAHALKAELMWANGSQETGFTPLTDYTPLLKTDGETLANGYVIDKALAFPPEATALVARVSDEEKTFDIATAIPERKKYEGTPLYKMVLISDVHIANGSGETNLHLLPQQKRTRDAINASDADFIVINGDIVQWYGKHSMAGEWDLAMEYYKGYNKPIYMNKGNHDDPNYVSGYVQSQGIENFSFTYYDNFLNDWLAYQSESGNYTVSRDESVDYYDTFINGQHFIFLAVPNDGYYQFGDAQLAWLDKILYEDEQSDKPIWLFAHIAANGSVNHTSAPYNNEIEDYEDFEAILEKHPNVIYVSGDTHYDLDSLLANTVNGEGIRPSFIHDGGVLDNNRAINEQSPDSAWGKLFGTNSTGIYAEVYEDRILLRARHFIRNEWLSQGISEITFAPKNSIKPFDLETYCGKDNRISIRIANADNSLTYTWYLDGAEIGSGCSLNVDRNSGTSLALRAENSQGNFRSESFDIITLAEVPVTSGDAGIRVDSDPAKTGIRFRADVAPRLREIATEYGFIVARKSILNLIGKTETDLTFDLTSADANCKLFVSGAAFTTDADGNITKDQSYRIDNETGTITYTGVCVGISKENYAESLVARPYAKIAVNGVSVTLYGSAVSTSMVDVAKAVQNAGGTYYEKHKDAIDGIVAG